MTVDKFSFASQPMGCRPNDSRASRAKKRAFRAETQIRQMLAEMALLPDNPGQRIHILFLDLYLKSTEQWLRRLALAEKPEYTYLVIEQFFGIYVSCVYENFETPLQKTPLQWQKYHRLSRKLTMASPISAHLRLIKLGVHAHIRGDLAKACKNAALNYKEMFGVDVDFEFEKPTVLGRDSGDAFKSAVFDFVRMHHMEQRGWRRIVLFWYKTAVVSMSAVWISVVQKWRRKAFSEAQL